MLSTYPATGGRERDAVVADAWTQICELTAAGEPLTEVDLDRMLTGVCSRWQETRRSFAVALLARSYDAMLEALERVSLAHDGGQPSPDLTSLLCAYKARIAIEKNLLGIDPN